MNPEIIQGFEFIALVSVGIMAVSLSLGVGLVIAGRIVRAGMGLGGEEPK